MEFKGKILVIKAIGDSKIRLMTEPGESFSLMGMTEEEFEKRWNEKLEGR